MLTHHNPHKPGRPSQTYHTYIMANLRLVLDVEVQAGNQSGSTYSAPGLLGLLERLPQASWPQFIRGDCDWGADGIMSDLEDVGMDYLFKLKKTKNVKELIYKHHCLGGWTRFKNDWEAKEDTLQLQGWGKQRRVEVVRRRLKKDVDTGLLLEHEQSGQQSLALIEDAEDLKIYEYAVLVISLDSDVVCIVQHYRNRADCENVFDEMKNQWGWGGFTTRDLKPCRLMARMIALIYNWWSLFVRMANPENHLEAITSKPLLLSSVGRLTKSGRQKKRMITSHHARAEDVREIFGNMAHFFTDLKAIAPQLTRLEVWQRMLSAIAEKILGNTGAGPPALSSATA